MLVNITRAAGSSCVHGEIKPYKDFFSGFNVHARRITTWMDASCDLYITLII